VISTVFQDEHLLSQKLHPRPCDDYNLAGQDERALKRPRLIQDWAERGHNSSSIPNSEHDNMASFMFQHMKGEDGEHSAVVWDAAPMSHIPGSLPPTDLGNSEEFKEKENNTEHTNERKDSTDTAKDKLDSKAGTRSDIIGPETMDNGTESVENTSPRTEPSSELIPQSFFVSSVLKGSSTVVDEQRLRQSLKEEIKVLHSDKSIQDVDVLKMWQKYEALVSCLSHSLCEELRLVLQPTQAAQLRGDYRTGKRLNMRRIIPYIASYFQNDRIWLRRTKPHKRDYQVLVAVDDSASMNENECSQMAYESLAMISSALTRLECGQLGILRFGEHAELLHSFDQPFSATCGAHVLQHLSFTQPRTNFVEMLQTANLLFSKFLEEKRGTSTSQLLLLLSDGRGVFADGTTQIEVEIRTLNEMGVLTVFVILDSLSKNSVLSIKVPSFASGKVPVIRSYLETFPFPFYIVLQDIKSLPIVLGKALQQWFELLSGPQ
jgi:midasin